MQTIKASMYMSPTRMMLVSPHLTADVHQHTVIQFTCALDGKPFSVWTEADGWRRVEAVLINSGVAHGVKDFGGWQATICIMPDVWQGSRIQNKVLEGRPVRYFEAKDIVPLLEPLQATVQQPVADSARFHSLANLVYQYLLQDHELTPPIDDRVIKAVHFIRQNIHDKIPASVLASEVYLSEDRFLHLFREQIGVPLRQYVLWQRLAAAIEAFIEGRSAKEAAYHAGFSDPAHFSRTFLQMFGALPSSYAAIKPLYHFAFFLDI